MSTNKRTIVCPEADSRRTFKKPGIQALVDLIGGEVGLRAARPSQLGAKRVFEGVTDTLTESEASIAAAQVVHYIAGGVCATVGAATKRVTKEIIAARGAAVPRNHQVDHRIRAGLNERGQ